MNSINAYRENKLYKKGKGGEKFFWHEKVKKRNVINELRRIFLVKKGPFWPLFGEEGLKKVMVSRG